MHDAATPEKWPDEIDRRLINALQGDFPLVAEPYRQVAEAFDMSEAELLWRLDSMLERRVLTRFGPMFQIERAGGAFVLAAMRVPDAEFERVAAQVNAFPEVAHNYRRDHALNMWFVLATATPQGIAETIAAIEVATGLPVFAFPKEREYFVEMKLRA
ncbi:MAG: AsnC family transcriptional regulator [Sulfuritalea sp.]|nr:AsnC family transcriptional regulator [Sulfuritalea sp.]